MEVTHIGHSSFKLSGKTVTVVTDPFNPQMVGFKYPKIEADMVTVSHQHDDHNFVEAVLGDPMVISGPGEYQMKGVDIIGVTSYHDDVQGSQRGTNNIYKIDIDKISFIHLGDLGHKLSDKQIELLNGVDILMIPVGGVYTISADLATQVVAQLEPKIIIPMHYNNDKLNQETFGKLTGVDVFLKEMGKEGIESQLKLNISKDKLPAEPIVVVLD